MNFFSVLSWIVGLMQLAVAVYALWSTRRLAVKKVAWPLSGAFVLLAAICLIHSLPAGRLHPVWIVCIDLLFAAVSILSFKGLLHLKDILNTKAYVEARLKETTSELERSQIAVKLASDGMATEVAERKRVTTQMEGNYRDMLTASRQAGMSEVATNVLHNVGNVLNSVNISASLVSDHLAQMKIASIARIARLFDDHSDDLAEFLTNDPKGRQLPDYLNELGAHLATEQASIIKEVEFVRKKIEHIKDIVAMQQGYARVSGVAETVKVTDLVEDALVMNSDALERHDVKLVREYDPAVPEISVEKHKVLQILVNLIRNAKYACDESNRKDKQMTVRVRRADDQVQIAVIDNGVGIPKENLTKIFNHGFTTRKGGHGFGLHSGALAAKELSGVLHGHSDGPGKGAVFTLELPTQSKSARKA